MCCLFICLFLQWFFLRFVYPIQTQSNRVTIVKFDFWLKSLNDLRNGSCRKKRKKIECVQMKSNHIQMPFTAITSKIKKACAACKVWRRMYATSSSCRSSCSIIETASILHPWTSHQYEYRFSPSDSNQFVMLYNRYLYSGLGYSRKIKFSASSSPKSDLRWWLILLLLVVVEQTRQGKSVCERFFNLEWKNSLPKWISQKKNKQKWAAHRPAFKYPSTIDGWTNEKMV